MRITPIEIRQKTFEKNFRGYEKDEVNAFLQTLSQEWERIMDENKELRIRLESTEREINKLREVENSLYKTLKTAEDTGTHVIEQARVTAELHLKESQLKAEALLNEAKAKAKDTIEESEVRTKDIIAEMEDRLKLMADNYRKLETAREDLLGDLKRLANDMLDRVERSRLMSKDFNPDQHLAMARRETKKIAFPNLNFDRPNNDEKEKVKEKIEHVPQLQVEKKREPIALKPEPVLVEAQPAKAHKSFFDEIG
jgi:cell division initiation protein